MTSKEALVKLDSLARWYESDVVSHGYEEAKKYREELTSVIMKSLTELEELKQEVIDRQETEDSLTKWVCELTDGIDELKRYPTADEVCEALSKWVKNNIPDVYNYKVYYDLAGFHYYNNCDYEEYLVEYERIDKGISLSVFLPPHVVIMIGRFYEGLEKAGKEE